MTRRVVITFLLLLSVGVATAETHISVVQGLGGSPDYDTQFSDQISAIRTASLSLAQPANVTVFAGSEANRERVTQHLQDLGNRLSSEDRFVLYLVGHGSFDGYDYKFNVVGPDLTGTELSELLETIEAATLLVNTSSASGAMRELLEPGRAAFALATRSGYERHATRFGEYFAKGLLDPAADLDKNNRISSSEAFDFAKKEVADFYLRENRLATEHPVMDARGANGLSLSRLDGVSSAASVGAGPLARRKQELNQAIETLRNAKSSYSEDEYQSLLLEKLIELAELEEQIEDQGGE